jgi:hypothetical protein
VLSGNSVGVPVHVPVNACGDTVDIVGLLNPTMGSSCGNVSQSSSVSTPPATPQHPSAPPVNPGGPKVPAPVVTHQPAPYAAPPAAHRIDEPRLADTGFDGRTAYAAGASGAVLLAGGLLLFRRAGRRAAHAR